MTNVFDLDRLLRVALEALPYPAYRRAMEQILFEQVQGMYREEMSDEQRDLWDRTVAVARSGVEPPTPFDEDGIDPARIVPVLAGLLEDWEKVPYGRSLGLHGALEVMKVYTNELAGVYPPYVTADYLGYAFDNYKNPSPPQAEGGLVTLSAIQYQPVESPAGDELYKALRLVEDFARGGPERPS